MKKYIKTNEYNITESEDIYDYDSYDEFDKEFDQIFGEPTTEVFEVNDFLRYMDEIIEYSEKGIIAATKFENSNVSDEFIIKNIIVTSAFESALKSQVKDHKTRALNNILDVVKLLLNYEVTKQFDNHPVKHNLKGHKDVHIDGGRLVLLYKYISPDKLRVDIKFDEDVDDVLKLQDLVDHKELDNYDKSKFNSSMKRVTYDELKKKAGLK